MRLNGWQRMWVFVAVGLAVFWVANNTPVDQGIGIIQFLIGLYAAGWGVGWVWRGFRKK